VLTECLFRLLPFLPSFLERPTALRFLGEESLTDASTKSKLGFVQICFRGDEDHVTRGKSSDSPRVEA
jgi:hypothetical protein